MLKNTITDTRIKIRPSADLIKLLKDNAAEITEVTENVAKILKRHGIKLSTNIEILNDSSWIKQTNINMKLLAELCNNSKSNLDNKEPLVTKTTQINDTLQKNKDNINVANDVYFYLNDLKWLNNFLAKLRKDKGIDVFLHNIIETCKLELPENEVVERNPELEARCQKLREQQQNLEYQKMTKNVDAALKNYPEDTIAYQMKALNKQIIAVLQFVFSVAAGFVFGFLGIQLIVGNLDFGFRLLLGIIFALIIALAEIYFLAKKLNEYDDVVSTSKLQTTSLNTKKKQHAD